MIKIDELSVKLGYQFDTFNGLNVSGLNKLKNFKILNQVLLKQEAKRLTLKLGEEHHRVKKLKEGIKENTNFIKELEIELEIAKIEIPEKPQNGALVYGRITDKTNRGIAGLVVFAEDEKGNTLRAFGNAETNASGFYSIQIEEGVLKKLINTDVYLTVASRRGKIIHREKKPLELKSNASVLVNIPLDRKTFTTVTKPTAPAKEKKGTGDTDITEEGKEKTIEISESENILENDLEKLKGIGPKYAQQLRDAGIKNIDQFINIDDEKLKKILGEKIFKRIKKMNTPLKK